MDDLQTITTRSATITRDATGIVTVAPHTEVVSTAQDAIDTIQQVRALMGARRLPLILDMRAAGPVQRDARTVYRAPEVRQLRSALAIVSQQSGVSRIMGNMILAVNARTGPTRIFATLEAARAWAQQFLPPDLR
jgi:hypothetical protein